MGIDGKRRGCHGRCELVSKHRKDVIELRDGVIVAVLQRLPKLFLQQVSWRFCVGVVTLVANIADGIEGVALWSLGKCDGSSKGSLCNLASLQHVWGDGEVLGWCHGRWRCSGRVEGKDRHVTMAAPFGGSVPVNRIAGIHPLLGNLTPYIYIY